MKLITFHARGDSLETVRRCVATEILRKIDSLQDADLLVLQHYGSGIGPIAIGFQELSSEEFAALPQGITTIP